MLPEIIDRLKAEVPGLKTVAGAAGWMDAAKKGAPLSGLPAAYLVPLAETAEPNRTVNGVSQRLHSHIGVALAAAGTEANGQGGSQAVALETLRASIKAALVGWQVSPAHRPFEFVQGQLLELDGQVLWWLDSFVTASQMRD